MAGSDSNDTERFSQNTIRAIEGILTVAMIISGSLSSVISPYYTISIMAILGVVLIVFILKIDRASTDRYKAKLDSDLAVRKAELEKEKDIEIAKLKQTQTPSPLVTRIRETHENEVVNLEGGDWTDCKFLNCEIVVEEGNFRVYSCIFDRCRLTAKGGAIEVIKMQNFFLSTSGPPTKSP